MAVLCLLLLQVCISWFGLQSIRWCLKKLLCSWYSQTHLWILHVWNYQIIDIVTRKGGPGQEIQTYWVFFNNTPVLFNVVTLSYCAFGFDDFNSENKKVRDLMKAHVYTKNWKSITYVYVCIWSPDMYVDDLAWNFGYSIANTLELLQFCSKPWMYYMTYWLWECQGHGYPSCPHVSVRISDIFAEWSTPACSTQDTNILGASRIDLLKDISIHLDYVCNNFKSTTEYPLWHMKDSFWDLNIYEFCVCILSRFGVVSLRCGV